LPKERGNTACGSKMLNLIKICKIILLQSILSHPNFNTKNVQ